MNIFSQRLLGVCIVGVGAAIAFVIAMGGVSAQTAADIQYPVAELGNCKDESACRSYCDKPEHLTACLAFAEQHNLMTDKELAAAKQFAAAGGKGPGGCTSKDACETYCDDIAHIDACISFAEQNNLIPPGELHEARKVQAAIRQGIQPPPCGGKEKCDAYCSEPANMRTCITFGEAAGLISGKELADAKKMLSAVERGVTPPACRGKQECDAYCGEPEHMEACMTFALEAGFMSEEEKAKSQKVLAAIKKGAKPPACKGKEECDAYCSEESHVDECISFAVAAGFMKPEEAEMAKKTGGKGPHGCKSKEECEAFCNNPENQETCFNFGKEHGLIPEEDLKRMEEGKRQFADSLNQAPPAVLECLSSSVGSEKMELFKSGAAMPPREIGDTMRACFEKGMGGPPGSEGQFQPEPGVMNPGGQMMPGQAGPGGCKTPEECQSYCASNPEACRGSGQQPAGMEGSQPFPVTPQQGSQMMQQMIQQGFPMQQQMPPQSGEPGQAGPMQPGMTGPSGVLMPMMNQQPPAGGAPGGEMQQKMPQMTPTAPAGQIQ